MTATTLTRCPQHIIKGNHESRITYFKKHLSGHAHLNTAHRDAMAVIGRSTGPRVVIITGPTGVGKSTLARKIYADLMVAHRAEAKRDRGFVPVAGISAVPPNGGSFSWKDMYVRLLTSHGDVMTDRKLIVPRQAELFVNPTAMTPLERSATDALRRALESSLKQRRTKVLIIDEAHHMLMVNDPTRLEYQFESIKSLTIETDVTIVLVGTYRLLDIRDQSGQLVRRSEIIHLPRYDMRQRRDISAFVAVGTELLHQLPLAQVPDLSKHWPYLYTKSAGCVGILKDWLARCLEDAINSRRKTFAIEHVQKQALANKALRTIIEEAIAGEEKLRDEDIKGIEGLLRGGSPVIAGSPDSPAPRTALRSKRRAGERNPVRDPAGGVRHVSP